ncbi:MAG: ASKHA domain-containing protein [Synergistaceae bacterium]|jgi:uncharacterized 2Fe-2S/4Fe-4S cluster protein (DUF4445 family)|nr:ASKHA domain-containing protein [Synergistaceae bacterium]
MADRADKSIVQPEVKVKFLREGIEVEVSGGALLSDVMRNAGVPLETPCNGMGVCGKCVVSVDERPVRACAHVLTQDVCVQTPPPQGAFSSIDRGGHIGVEAGDASGAGVAVDLGTTGLSACLVLKTGETVARASCLNPQTQYGGDVLTRASWCRGKPENLEKLRRSVVEALNGLIDEMLAASSIGRDSIRRVVVAGNTVMQHIFAGVDPTPLTCFPFRSVFEGAVDVSAPGFPSLGLDVANARVCLLPCVSAFLGGDVVAGVLASGFAHENGNSLFIDIGTNGEIVLRLDGKLYGTSTAAGPALEGMNISCGVRAVPGAIERVFTEFADGQEKIAFRTIGDAPPVGLCGSALIDLTAVLLRKGVIDATGFLDCPDGKYRLADNVFLSRKDIRQIQLAKGAIAAGIKTLLRAAGGRYETLDSIDIAGAFGFHLDFENLMTIGMIDREFRGTVRFVGNTSLEGARLCLPGKKIWDDATVIARTIKPVELSESPDFQEAFIRELGFPRCRT